MYPFGHPSSSQDFLSAFTLKLGLFYIELSLGVMRIYYCVH